MDNATRRALLQRHRQSGFPGSIMDVFRAYEQGVDLVGQYMQQQQQQMQPPPVQVARTPEEQRQGLRPAHQAGNVNQSMAFPNIAPNTPFNTVGMKAPINIDKYDEQGHLVESYKSVPPGVQNLPTGPHRGTVIETPANMQSGGRRLKKDALEMFPALEALGDVKVKTSKRFTKEKTGIGDIEYFAPGQEQVTYPTGKVFKHPGSDKKHAVLVNPDTNNAQSVALDLLHGLTSVDPEYKSMVEAFGNSLDEEEIKYWYDQDVESGLAMDGYDQFRQNYVDGKIRNLLFEGTPEDFKQARYNPDEKTYIQLTNPDAFEQFQRIKQHLKGHREYQSAGEVKPYRATSKEDYRYRQRMYDDSLNHHLATLKQIELMGQKEDFRGFGPQVADKPSDYQQPWTLDHLKKRTAEGRNWSSLEEAVDDGYPFFDELDEELYKYYINDLGFSKDVIGLTGSPDVFSSTIEPSYSYYDGYAQSPYYPAPKQPIAPFNEIQRLKPLGLSGSTVQPLAERDIIRNTRELPKPGKQPELIMRTNQGMRTGQEPNYYKVWDDKGKQWSTRPVEPEELDRYRKENKRVEPIVTPPISFKDGGPRKFQGAGSVTKDKVNWYDTIDFRKWGLQDYGDSGTFNSAFKDARESGADEFVWKDNRYTTKLASKKTDDLYEDSKEFISRYINKADYPTGLPPYMDMFQWRDFVADSVGNDNSNAYYDAYFKPEDTSKVPLTPHRKKYLAEEGRKAAAENIDDPFYFSITEQKGDLKEEGHVDKSRATQVYTMGLPRMFIYNDPNQKGLGTTAVHELAHKNLQSGEKLWDPEQRGVPSQKKLIDNIKEIGTQYYDGINTVEDFQYLTRPSEVEARKISTLYYLEKEKGKDIFKTKVTRDDLAKMRDDENLPYDIGQLLEIFKFHETELLDYLNNHIAEQKKRGGPRKFQNGSFADRNYLPPVAQAIEKAGGFDQYQANFAQAEELRDLNSRPTISQGTFDVDEAGNIVEDNPSFLEMAANPMATARTLLDPSVEGLPSQVEFDKAAGRGTVAGTIANDIVNPAAWVNYGANAVSDLSQGNFVGAGLNALGAIPGIGYGALAKQGLQKAGVSGIGDIYKINPYRANPYGFRNVGDTPHWLRGYEQPIDPMRMDLSRGAGLDEFVTAKNQIEGDAFYAVNPRNNLSRALAQEQSALNKLFEKSPFKDDMLGEGGFGQVFPFKNDDYVLKLGKNLFDDAKSARYSGTTDDFLQRVSQFGDQSNIATPLRYKEIPGGAGEYDNAFDATIMRNLNNQPSSPGVGKNPTRDAYASALRQVRRMRDKGIALDVDNPMNVRFNTKTGQFDMFDLENVPQLAARNPNEWKAIDLQYGNFPSRSTYKNPVDYGARVRDLLRLRGAGIPGKPNQGRLRFDSNFKAGGPRQFQGAGFADRNYLPPIVQEIERAGGFDQYQANLDQAEETKKLSGRPTISQGNFDVDEEGMIVENNPSALEMLANPMATLRTVIDPSVEGLPSRVEFDQAKARGNMAGQIANDMRNPAAWANYGVNAVKALGRAGYAAYQGEGMEALGHLGSAGLNALGAVPGIPGAVGVGSTAIKYGRNPYLLNANRANKYDFHSIGDKPHFWKGYETPITDPSKLSPSSNFGGYLDDLQTAERLAKRPVAQQAREESRALFGEFPAGKEANDFANTVFKRMDEAASDARTAFNQRHAPFLGDEIGRGAYGRVSQFKNNPDYVFKIGRSEGANAKPNFLRALEPFQNRSNIATPLQKANFPLKDPHFGIRQGTGEALVMRNLNSPTFGTQQFAGLNARQARALQIKTARQLRDAGIGLDFAADAGNLASSNVSPNLTNFFDLHYRPGLQHDSRYLANQYLRKKLGGPRK